MSNIGLTVTVQNERSVNIRRQDGGEARGDIDLDRLRRATISVFQDLLNESRIKKRQELVVLGTHLYRALFNGPAAGYLENALAGRPESERLRVQLSFQDEAVELADL